MSNLNSAPDISWDIVKKSLLLNELLEEQIDLGREEFRDLVGDRLDPFVVVNGFIKEKLLVIEFEEEVIVSYGSQSTLEQWRMLVEGDSVLSPEDFLFKRFELFRKIDDLGLKHPKPIIVTGHSLGGVYAYLAADPKIVQNVIVFGDLRTILSRSVLESRFPEEKVLSIQNSNDPLAQHLWEKFFPHTILAQEKGSGAHSEELIESLKVYLAEATSEDEPLRLKRLTDLIPGLQDHSMESYKSLVAILEKENSTPENWFVGQAEHPIKTAPTPSLPSRRPLDLPSSPRGAFVDSPPPSPTLPPLSDHDENQPGTRRFLQESDRLKSPLKVVVLYHDKDQSRAGDFVDSLRLLFDGFADVNDGYLAGASGLVGVLRVLTAVPCPVEKIGDYLSDSLHSIIVVLGDDSLVKEPSMMSWLNNACEKTKETPEHIILPIALHDRAFDCLDGCDHFTTVQRKVATKLGEDSVQGSYVALLVLHEAYKLLADQVPNGKRLKVFLSHAKKDGLPLAHAINAQMDHLPGRLSENRFYDSENLDPGKSWKDQLLLHSADCVMLILRTRAYESRAWCREEFMIAMRAGVPIIVIEARSEDGALSSSDSSSAEARRESILPFNNFPVTHIRDGNLIRVLGLALTEGLRHLVFERDTQQLENLGLVRDGQFKRFNPATKSEGLLQLCYELEKGNPNRQTNCFILHPEPELNELLADSYLRILQSFFENGMLSTCNKVYDVAVTGDMETSLQNKVIGISIAEVQGTLSAVEVNKLILHAVDRLFTHGATIAFGHDWREGGVMEAVYDRMKHSVGYGEDSTDIRIINASPWNGGQSNARQKEIEANLQSLKILEPGLPDFVKAIMEEKGLRTEDWHKVLFALGLSKMRVDLTERCHARICIGGKMADSSGAMAGILEEAAFALEASQPLYLCGHWGGATGKICELIQKASDKQASGIKAEDFAPKSGILEKIKEFEEGSEGRPKVYLDLEKAFATVSDATFETLASANGLSVDENRELFELSDIRQIMGLVLKGLTSLPANE